MLQALVSKQVPLLTRLDQLDEECGALHERLWGVESEREELRGKLADMQMQCVGLKGELASEKVFLKFKTQCVLNAVCTDCSVYMVKYIEMYSNTTVQYVSLL